MLRVWLNSLETAAPGLCGWQQSLAVLGGREPYRPRPMAPYTSRRLPPNERRRISLTTRLALRVIEALLERVRLPATDLETVFTSSGGDMEIIHRICSALALPDRPLSPTQFHNSVHNAPAGYYAIATGSRRSSSCLAAHDGSFAAGLLEAATLGAVEARHVLLVAYDELTPQPLHRCRPLSAPFGAALLLGPEPLPGSLARLELDTVQGQDETVMTEPALESLRRGNPIARSLPLLEAVLRPGPDCGRRVVLPWLADLQLAVDCRPC